MNYTIKHNTEKNGLEIYFDGKPAEEVREALKGLCFRWHSMKKCWYGRADEAAVVAAIGGKKAETKPAKATKKKTTTKKSTSSKSGTKKSSSKSSGTKKSSSKSGTKKSSTKSSGAKSTSRKKKAEEPVAVEQDIMTLEEVAANIETANNNGEE